MQTDLIETFLDLCETRSFHQTADRLGLTQSTVSGRIRTLEAALGVTLLTRGRGGTRLTTEGLRFEPHARALRLAWAEAQSAARGAAAALTLRIGIQHDLLGARVGDWVAAFRAGLPDAAFYVEGDYSSQMCADLTQGALDLALLYTPKPHPDLHFETLGEVTYRMVSTETDRLAAIRADRYILANYAPAFARTHAELLPHLTTALLSSGQNTAVAGLLAAQGGAAYVLADTAADLAASGAAQLVADAPPIPQNVHVALHLKNRHRSLHRRLLRLLRARFRPGG